VPKIVLKRDHGPDTRPGQALNADDLAELAAEVLGSSPYPALVLEVPSQRIVAAGPGAARLLDPTGAPVVNHLLEEFTADQPMVGTDLLAGGRLNGFESFRVLRRARGAGVKVRMWVRTFERQPPSRLVLVVLIADRIAGKAVAVATQAPPPPTPAVVGTINAELCIERISGDAAELFGVPMDRLLGRPVANFVAGMDRDVLSAAFEAATAGTNGVTVTVDIEVPADDGTSHAMGCEVLLLPLDPAPSCVFVLLPTQLDPTPHAAESLPAILARFGAGAEIAHLAHGVFSGTTERDVPGLGTLTTRELEIVGQLLDGNRAPAIATKLFLTPSTVRNHLAAVFAKLGVNSQQQLVNLFRRA
jgi:DNA-binding CsgD family transcriptional regulator